MVNGATPRNPQHGSRDRSQSRFDLRVSHSDRQLRRGVWRIQRRPNQRHYEIRQQCIFTRCFEFLRNTDLDARNYFSPTRGTFIQNQFGGTFGGPIKRSKIFFFSDYQGTRQRQGVDTGLIPVPSMQDRTGNLSDLASSFYTTEMVNGQSVVMPITVSGPAWADTLSNNFGYQVYAGEPYYFPGCTNTNYSATPATACVLPTLQIPAKAWSAPAQHLLQYIPAPNVSGDQFTTSAYNQALRDDKGAIRLDANTNWGLISGYYFVDDYSLNNPYPVAQGGASVPGFNALYLGRAQLFSLGDTEYAECECSQRNALQLHASIQRSGQTARRSRCRPCVWGFVTA